MLILTNSLHINLMEMASQETTEVLPFCEFSLFFPFYFSDFWILYKWSKSAGQSWPWDAATRRLVSCLHL